MSVDSRRSDRPAPGAGGGAGAGSVPRPPSWGTVAVAQARLLARKKWKTLAAIPLGMGIFVLPWLYMLLVDAGASPGAVSATFVDLLLGPLYLLALLVAFAWALALWSDEGPGDRAYHWSLPVERPVHDLTRVGAGAAIFLGTGAAAVLLWTLPVTAVTGAITPGPARALFLIGLVLLLGYLLGAVPALLSDHPARWTIGTVLAYAVGTGILVEMADRWHWLEPLPGALLLWLGLAAAAVVGIAFFHLERAKGAAA